MADNFFDAEDTVESPEDFFDSDDTIEEETPVETPTMTESALRGASQGVTLGFGDELGAGAYSAFDRLKGLLGGDSVSSVDEQLAEQGFTGDIGGSLYEDLRDEERAELKAAEEANPNAYLAGEIGASMVLPAGSVGATGKAASTVAKAVPRTLSGVGKAALKTGLKTAPRAITEAGIYGAGQAEELEQVPEAVLESAKDAALLSTAIPVVGSTVSQGLRSLGGKAAKAAVKFTSGLPADKVDEIFANPEKFSGVARSLTDIAKDVEGRVNRLGEEARSLSSSARQTLGEEKEIGVQYFTDLIKDKANELRRTDDSAKKALREYAGKIERDYIDGVSQKDWQEIIDDMSDLAFKESGDRKTSGVAKAFGDLRKSFSNELKANNPAYKKDMAESAQRMDYLSKLTKRLGVQDDFVKAYDEFGDIVSAERGLKFKNVDSVANKLKSLAKEDKADLRDLLLNDEAQKFLNIGEDLANEVELREFQKWADKQGYSTRAITTAKAILGSAGFSLSMGNPVIATALGGAAAAPYISSKVLKDPSIVSRTAAKADNLVNVIPKAMEKNPKLATRIAAISGAEAPEDVKNDPETRSKVNMARLEEAQPEQLTELAEAFRQQGRSGEEFARVLDQANQNEDKRKAILFTLQQQPAFRKLLEKVQDKK